MGQHDHRPVSVVAAGKEPTRRIQRMALAVTVALPMVAAVLAMPAAPAHGAAASRSQAPVLTIPPPRPTMVGSSTLVRTDSGVSVSLKTTGLEPGEVATLWWIVANEPQECEAGIPGLSQCGPGDHMAGRGDLSVLRAAGRIVGDSGGASYGAHLRVGDTSGALVTGEPGLLDPRGAEVILIVKTHGPKIPGLTAEMLKTFAGGCHDQTAPPNARPEMIGPAGPNHCAEIQISVHSAGQ